MFDRIAVQSIRLTGSITGAKLIELSQGMSAATGEETFVPIPRWRDGERVMLGHESSYPYKDVAIVVDNDIESLPGPSLIDPAGTYSRVAVMSHTWPGAKHAIAYSEKSVISTVKEFASIMQKLYDEIAR